jgi:uncharacterized membrane protein
VDEGGAVAQHATESILVAAPAAVVYGVISDVERYGQWVSELKSVTVRERDADGRALEVAFRAAAFGRSTTYTLRYDYAGSPETLAWTQVDGDLTESMDGAYHLDDRGASTLVTYDLSVDLRVPIPGFVRERAAHRIQSEALRELRARAEHLA